MTQNKPVEEMRRTAEPEFKGPIWKHPYMLYIWLVALLFGALCFIGWLGYTNGWIPNPRVHS